MEGPELHAWGSGTADMIRQCERAGVPVWRVGWE